MSPQPESAAKSWVYSSYVRVVVAVLGGIVAASVYSQIGPRATVPLVGWDVAATIYVLWVAFTAFRLKADQTAKLASSEDPDRATSDVIMVFASLASLAAVGLILVDAGKAEGVEKIVYVLTGAVSVFLSWLLIHTAYALRYARLYYDDCKGGINFNSDEDPDYGDFAYLAYTVGMTFQVSDTNITDRRIRGNVLRHALLSYVFGTVIVATTINLVAGLSK